MSVTTAAPVNLTLHTLNVENNLLNDDDNIGTWDGKWITNKGAPIKYMLNYNEDYYIIFFIDKLAKNKINGGDTIKMILIDKTEVTEKNTPKVLTSEGKYRRIKNMPDKKLPEKITEEFINFLYNDTEENEDGELLTSKSTNYNLVIDSTRWNTFIKKITSTTAAPKAAPTTAAQTKAAQTKAAKKGLPIGVIIFIVIGIIIGVAVFVIKKKKTPVKAADNKFMIAANY